MGCGASSDNKNAEKYREDRSTALSEELDLYDQVSRKESKGDEASEPSDLVLSMQRKMAVTKARMSNGITDDVDQFAKEIAESAPETPERDKKRVRLWAEEVRDQQHDIPSPIVEWQETRRQYKLDKKNGTGPFRKGNSMALSRSGSAGSAGHVSPGRSPKRVGSIARSGRRSPASRSPRADQPKQPDAQVSHEKPATTEAPVLEVTGVETVESGVLESDEGEEEQPTPAENQPRIALLGTTNDAKNDAPSVGAVA